MEGALFDETELYRALARSGARTLLIGRRALIAWGIPVITADYDIWIPSTDIELLNASMAPLDMFPNASPTDARSRGRYVIENGERIDVLVAKSVPTVEGEHVDFEALWTRREELEVAPGVRLAVPSLEDLILTKRFGGRPKDAEDIRLLRGRLEER